MKITHLQISKDNKNESCEVDSIRLIAGQGIENDVRSGGNRQISFWSDESKAELAALPVGGFCAGRFSANAMVDHFDDGSFLENEVIYIGDAEVRITQVGKRCFEEECALWRAGIACPLQTCRYGIVETSGTISLGDEAVGAAKD